MNEDAKDWWEASSEHFQEEAEVPVAIHYGPGAPNESDLQLIDHDLDDLDVIELGCGGAQGSVAFAERGAHVTGVDISEEQLKYGRQLCTRHGVDVELLQGNLENLNMIDDDQFDLAYSAYAYHWVDDIEQAFTETHRVLQDNGTFLFSLPHPFYQHLKYKAENAVNRHYLDSGRENVANAEVDGEKVDMVVYSRTMSQLIQALREARFDIAKVVEPDPREANDLDEQGGNWLNKDVVKHIPCTIIFKAKA